MRPPIRITGPLKQGSNFIIPDLPRTADRLWKRLYIRENDEELEKLSGFRPGGYHPIHLQDKLCDGRYRIVHKLGHGGYSTVWLCRDQHVDTPSYVALKILIASEREDNNYELLLADKLKKEGIEEDPSEYNLCLPLHYFTSQSPNGTHLCLVYPVLGPMARDTACIYAEEENAISILQKVSRQAVGSLATLHDRGICHGDFRPSNILLELQSLHGLDDDQMLSILGEPDVVDIHIRKDSHPTPEIPYAPKYLVYPLDFKNVDLSAILPHTHVIDFGQSFDTSQRPLPGTFGIPVNYAAPEVALNKSGSMAMDLWSLGCTIFEIRLGRRLFDIFQLMGFDKKEYVRGVGSLLGEPPEPWAEHYSASDDESDTSMAQYHPPLRNNGDIHLDPQVRRAHSIQEKLAMVHDCTGQDCNHPRSQLISEVEAAALADLLENLLRYKPEERLSARDALKHTWFHTQY